MRSRPPSYSLRLQYDFSQRLRVCIHLFLLCAVTIVTVVRASFRQTNLGVVLTTGAGAGALLCVLLHALYCTSWTTTYSMVPRRQPRNV